MVLQFQRRSESAYALPSAKHPGFLFTSVPTSLYHAVLGKLSDLHSQQSWLISLPVSLVTLLYSYILLYKHCLAIQVCLPCPARDVYL